MKRAPEALIVIPSILGEMFVLACLTAVVLALSAFALITRD